VECHLAVGVAELSAQVPAVNFAELQSSQVPQPKIERQFRLGRVPGEITADVEISFLEHVRIVDAALEPAT
jgi:hypothetical protein